MDEHTNLINKFHSLRGELVNTQELLDSDPNNVDLQTQITDQTQLVSDNLTQLQGYVP